MRYINRIVLHYTGGWDYLTFEDIQTDWVKRLGWKSPGYHYLINKAGECKQLAKLSEVTNGVLGYNKDSVHISTIGGIVGREGGRKDGALIYGDTRTDAQKETILETIHSCLVELKKSQPIDHITIVGHRDMSKDLNGNEIIEEFEWEKECPGYDAIKEYGWISGNKGLERLLKRSTY